MKITKKIFGVVSLVAVTALSLVSCSTSSEDLSVTRKATPSDEIKELYNLNFTTDGQVLYESDTYSIYVAKDIKASLFTNQIDVLAIKDINDKNLVENDGDKLRNITSQSLVFSDGTSALYTTEITQYLNLFYNTTDGIAKLANSEYLGFTPDYSVSWTKTSDLKTPYEYYKNNNLTELKCNVVYIPTYFVRKNNGNIVLEQYIITPIYTAYTYSNGETEIINGEAKSSTIKDIKKVSLKFREGSSTILAV